MGTQHRKHKFEQQETHHNPGGMSGDPEGYADGAPLETVVVLFM